MQLFPVRVRYSNCAEGGGRGAPGRAPYATAMRITLALGSGGARGYAHIGVIEELERRGHEIAAISGCSMGALVGGVYAAGKLPELKQFVTSLKVSDIVRLIDPSLADPGMIKAEKVMDMLREFIGEIQIEDLPIPYLAVATDLVARREVWFRSGHLDTAIRASIAIPTVITPVMVHGRLLCDGGLLNPLPLEPAAMMPSDGVVAVSLFGRRPQFGTASPVADHAEEDEETGWTDRLKEQASGLLQSDRVSSLIEKIPFRRDKDLDEYEREKVPRHISSMDMLTMSLDALQAVIEATRTANTPPDVLISVPTEECGVMDFHKGTEMVELGRTLAAEAFDRAGL